MAKRSRSRPPDDGAGGGSSNEPEQLTFEMPPATDPEASEEPSPPAVPVIVRLKKAFSWQSNYAKYPFYLAQADASRTYSRDEVFTQIFRTGGPPTHSRKFDWVAAIFGLSVDSPQREVLVEGIGLVVKADDGQYRVSPEGVSLARAYAEDPSGPGWRQVFADILARHDVRTRAVLYHLGVLGYGLRFPDQPAGRAFRGAMKNVELVSGGETIPLLADARPEPGTVREQPAVFNQLLSRYRTESLGPFLARQIEALGLSLAGGIDFQGGKLPGFGKIPPKVFAEPSTNDLTLYLRQTLSLFADIGVLAYDPERQVWVADRVRAAEVLSREVVGDLFDEREDDHFYEALRQAYRARADQDGLAQVRRLREDVCGQLGVAAGRQITYFNRQVARLLSEGHIVLGKTMPWHGNTSDALFGDPAKQYIQLLF